MQVGDPIHAEAPVVNFDLFPESLHEVDEFDNLQQENIESDQFASNYEVHSIAIGDFSRNELCFFCKSSPLF